MDINIGFLFKLMIFSADQLFIHIQIFAQGMILGILSL